MFLQPHTPIRQKAEPQSTPLFYPESGPLRPQTGQFNGYVVSDGVAPRPPIASVPPDASTLIVPRDVSSRSIALQPDTPHPLIPRADMPADPSPGVSDVEGARESKNQSDTQGGATAPRALYVPPHRRTGRHTPDPAPVAKLTTLVRTHENARGKYTRVLGDTILALEVARDQSTKKEPYQNLIDQMYFMLRLVNGVAERLYKPAEINDRKKLAGVGNSNSYYKIAEQLLKKPDLARQLSLRHYEFREARFAYLKEREEARMDKISS